MLKGFVDTVSGGMIEYVFDVGEVTYDGDAANAPLTISVKLGDISLKSFSYRTDFVKQDGRWYIKEFQDQK